MFVCSHFQHGTMGKTTREVILKICFEGTIDLYNCYISMMLCWFFFFLSVFVGVWTFEIACFDKFVWCFYLNSKLFCLFVRRVFELSFNEQTRMSYLTSYFVFRPREQLVVQKLGHLLLTIIHLEEIFIWELQRSCIWRECW